MDYQASFQRRMASSRVTDDCTAYSINWRRKLDEHPHQSLTHRIFLKMTKYDACFICDPPNPLIRVSVCCDSDTYLVVKKYTCTKCKEYCDTKDEEMCIVTCDMSGAELRIIAELANAKTWIMAFNKGWDVHSVSTEILEPQKWPALQCLGGEKYFDKEKNKEVIFHRASIMHTRQRRRRSTL